MSSVTLSRASGLALLLGAALFIIGLALTLVFPPGTPPGIVITSVWASGLMLLLLGLPGIAARQAARAGWLGLVGLFLTYVGEFLGISYFVVFYLIMVPWFAVHAPQVTGQFLLTNPIANAVGAMTSWVGLVLLGIATICAGVFSRWAGLLLVVAVAFDFFTSFGGPVSRIAGPLSNVTLAFTLGWMGYTLLTTKAEAKVVPQPVLAS